MELSKDKYQITSSQKQLILKMNLDKQIKMLGYIAQDCDRICWFPETVMILKLMKLQEKVRKNEKIC